MAITEKLFEEVVLKLAHLSAIELPSSVLAKLKEKADKETNPMAKKQFEAIFENCKIATEKRVSLCQDNGLPQMFIDFGQKCRMEGNFEAAAQRAYALATKQIPLRENAIHPLSYHNPGTNVGPNMPSMQWRPIVDADYLEVTVIPKGNGGEMHDTHSWVLTSEEIKPAVIRSVLDCVADMMGEPCPPVIIGIGLGGQFDVNSILAKRALFRDPIGAPSPDPLAAELEKDVLDAVNSLKLGPMGFGGETYAVACHIELASAHTAIVPITVAFQCWAHRFSKARIYDDGRVEYLTHPNANKVS